LQLAAAVESPAAAYLAKNNDKFKQMLNTVGVDDKAINSMQGILLAPSNAAVDAFVSSMDGMTLPELLRNKLLVDQATAYHFLPGVKVTSGLKVPSMPLITKTGNASLAGEVAAAESLQSQDTVHRCSEPALCPAKLFQNRV
jgi:hypothetical protein